MFEFISLRESTPAKEGPLLVSKALKTPVLVDASEMEKLFTTLEKECGHFSIYFAQGVCKKGEEGIEKKSFLAAYAEYIDQLKNRKVPQEELFRPLFSSF